METASEEVRGQQDQDSFNREAHLHTPGFNDITAA